MFYLTCLINIGPLNFSSVQEVSIKSSWDSLADTASITLANAKKVKIESQIKVGDPVNIKLGYDYKLFTEFDGYVTSISPNSPLKIECKDSMYIFENVTLNETMEDTSPKEIVEHIFNEAKSKHKAKKPGKLATIAKNTNIAQLSETLVEAAGLIKDQKELSLTNKLSETSYMQPDQKIKAYRLDNVTAAQALQDLKDRFKLIIYFRGKELFVGEEKYAEKKVGMKTQAKYKTRKVLPTIYLMQQNVVQSNLTYSLADDQSAQARAVSVNKEIDVPGFGTDTLDPIIEKYAEKSDDSGPLNTKVVYGVLDEKDVQRIADNMLQENKYDGYRGSLTVFGTPFVMHGFKAVILDKEYILRSGTYFIDAVNTTFGTSGFRREITLGEKTDSKFDKIIDKLKNAKDKLQAKAQGKISAAKGALGL